MKKFLLLSIVIALLSVALPLSLRAFVYEPDALRIEYEVLRTNALPSMRIVLISDLHAGAHFIDEAKLRAITRAANNADGDIIVLLGDYLNNGRTSHGLGLKGAPMAPETLARELVNLRAKQGTFAILGNHDWWFDGDRIARAFENANITVLENRAQEITLSNGARFWLAGVPDYYVHGVQVDTALATVPADASVVVLTHNPDVFPYIPARVALTLAGHTHGGQVRMPFIGAPVSASEHGSRYRRGHVQERGHHLFVTSGVGTSLLPVRFGVRPEIVVLTTQPTL